MYIGAMPEDNTEIIKSAGGALAGLYILPKVLPPKYKTFAMITGAIAGWMLAGKAMRSELYGFVGPHTPMIGTHGLSDHAVYPQVQPSNVVTLD